MTGLVYGYNFTYKVENKLTGAKGYFDIKPIATISEKDKNVTLTQLEESSIFMRVQALYRLTNDQKLYITGFNSSMTKSSNGEALGRWTGDWSSRLDIYKDALRNAVLNAARRSIQSRPQYIKGKLLLRESPKFLVDAGDWRCLVKIDLSIQDVSYIDSY